MDKLKISGKLATYFAEVEAKTGRKINLRSKNDLGLPGMSAAFSKHPTDIFITFNPSRYQSHQELEKSLAHEATHGLLLYGKGYYSAKPKTKMSAVENQSLGLLHTMIDDIVVNKLIHEKGFEPYSSAYLPMLLKETKAAKKGKDIYKDFSYDKSLKEKFMIFRYILAWGVFEYFDLDTYEKRTIKKFLKSFEKAYPEQFEIATKIKFIIKDNNIFTVDGHFTTITKCLPLWGMDDKVNLETA